MKTLLRTAIAALSFASIGPAIAGEGDGPSAITFFSSLPGVIAQAPAEHVAAVTTTQNRQAVPTYIASSSRGTWLSQPNQNGGANG